MPTLTEKNRNGEFLLSEANGSFSREVLTIAAAAPAMVSGTLLGRITASGKYTAYNNGAADGSEVARGVLYTSLDDTATDQSAVVIVRNAEVAAARLAGSDAPGVADLLAIGVIVR